MTNTPDPYACTLDPDGARARLSQARQLTSRLQRRERLDNRLLLQFHDDGHTRELLEKFVHDEQQCCAFFEFHIQQDADHVVLELSAPKQASHMLDAAMEAFDPALDDSQQVALQQAHATEPAHDHDRCVC